MDDNHQDIGKNIRRLRKEKGLTLAGMAERCRCSSSLISQIETGAVNPSLSTLKEVSDALGITIASLFTAGPNSENAIFSLMKAQERKSLTTQEGVTFQLLSRKIDFPCEFILNEWPPGASTGKDAYTHEGEECGLLLEGKLDIEIDGQTYHMKPGDTITLKSSAPHRIWNPGKKRAVAVWVNTTPWMFAIK